MDELNKLWNTVLQDLEQELTEVSVDTWIRPIKPVALSDTTITLSVPGAMNKNMIMSKFRSLIENSIAVTAGRSYDLEVLCDTPEETEVPDDPIFQESALNPRYTFESFVVGGTNHLAYAAARGVADAAVPKNASNPLFIYGGSGLGKTHLLQAIGNSFLQQHPQKKVLYTTSEKFNYELILAIQKKTNEDFRIKYRTVDLLMIDDIQFLANKELAQEEFFHTFNALYDNGKQIVLTSDRLPSATPHLTERLKTRFQSGLMADIQPPEYETRIAILRSKIEEGYFTFDEEIVEYVANNITSNVRDLEGALKRILAYAGIERTNTISLELAQKALKEILSTLPQRNITIPVIIDEVEKYFHLPSGSLVSKRRSNDVTFPRHIAMYISREVLDESYTKIGQEMKRDHATVMAAEKKIRQNLTVDKELEGIISDLVDNIHKN